MSPSEADNCRSRVRLASAPSATHSGSDRKGSPAGVRIGECLVCDQGADLASVGQSRPVYSRPVYSST
jgi:hypothetical protein